MASKSRSKVSFEDLAIIIGLHLPTLRVLYPEVEAELRELGQRNETDLNTLIPKTMQALETLREINRLVTTEM